jgi:predicted nucleotidyltransferase
MGIVQCSKAEFVKNEDATPSFFLNQMKNQKIKIKNTLVNISDLKSILEECHEVSAAFLFGSAASGEYMANDLDILVLLHQDTDKNEAFFDLTSNLSKSLKVPEAAVDLLFFDLEEADLSILTRAVNRGIMLINHDPEYLSNMIDNLSRYLLENETMIIRARRLRQERMEVFGET